MGQQPVSKFGLFEQAFAADRHYANPYTEVSATATLRSPDGEERRIPLFYDGDTTWRLRFSPDHEGAWSYQIDSSDPRLHGAAGTFTCAASALRGGIQPMRGYPYHFQYQDGTPLWFFGDTQWRAFATEESEHLNRSSVCHYIDVRAGQGYNYVHTDVMGGGGIDGGQKVFFDFAAETINIDFFREMDYRVRYMNEKGITSGIVLAWHRGPEAWDAFASEEAWLRYTRYIVARYSAFNVCFIVSGEWDQIKTERRARFQAVGREIMAWDPHNRMRGIHPCQRRTVEEFAEDDWMSFGDYQQMYQAPHDREATAAERHALHAALLATRVHQKPVLNTEYAYYRREMAGHQDYVHIQGIDKPHSHSLDSFRRASWVLVMAGGYFVTGFGTTYFGGRRDAGPFDVDAAKNDDAEADLVHLREFWQALPWWKLDPAAELVAADQGFAYCLSDRSSTAVVYCEEAASVRVHVEPGDYQIQRYDPRTGEYDQVEDCAPGPVLHLATPDTQDWVYLITRQDN